MILIIPFTSLHRGVGGQKLNWLKKKTLLPFCQHVRLLCSLPTELNPKTTSLRLGKLTFPSLEATFEGSVLQHGDISIHLRTEEEKGKIWHFFKRSPRTQDAFREVQTEDEWLLI